MKLVGRRTRKCHCRGGGKAAAEPGFQVCDCYLFAVGAGETSVDLTDRAVDGEQGAGGVEEDSFNLARRHSSIRLLTLCGHRFTPSPACGRGNLYPRFRLNVSPGEGTHIGVPLLCSATIRVDCYSFLIIPSIAANSASRSSRLV